MRVTIVLIEVTRSRTGAASIGPAHLSGLVLLDSYSADS